MTEKVKSPGKVKLSTRVPHDQKLNGLAPAAARFVADPEEVVYAVVKLGVDEIRSKVHRNDADDDEGLVQVPILEVLASEPIWDPELLVRVKELYKQAYFQRTGDGENTLPGDVIEMPQGYRDARETGELGNASGIPSPAFAGPGTDPT